MLTRTFKSFHSVGIRCRPILVRRFNNVPEQQEQQERQKAQQEKYSMFRAGCIGSMVGLGILVGMNIKTIHSMCTNEDEISVKNNPEPQSIPCCQKLWPDILERLMIRCKRYISDSDFVFKCCNDCIVVLCRCTGTETNESRRCIRNPQYARYRGNHFRVVEIIDLKDNLMSLHSVKSVYDKNIVYTVGEIVKSDFFVTDLNKVNTHGIHFFRTIGGALSYVGIEFGAKLIGTGVWEEWHTNGQLERRVGVLNGKRHGIQETYDENGVLVHEHIYTDGVLVCDRKRDYKNGTMSFRTYNDNCGVMCSEERKTDGVVNVNSHQHYCGAGTYKNV